MTAIESKIPDFYRFYVSHIITPFIYPLISLIISLNVAKIIKPNRSAIPARCTYPLGIIGHEIGHVLKHHSKNAFRTELLTGAVKDAVGSTSNKAAALTDSQLGTLGQSLIGAKYSQKQENEADDCGYDFLVANGRNPWGMVMSFEKFLNMEDEQGAKSTVVQRMFSSHPETQKRIDRMKARCVKDGFTRPEGK